MRTQTAPRSPERGSATVLAAGVLGALATLFLAAALVGAVAVARNQAQTAADLAAVAGAQELMAGRSEAEVCSRAARFVVANDARMHRCQIAGRSRASAATVLIEVGRPVLAGTPWVATASGRAGLVPRQP